MRSSVGQQAGESRHQVTQQALRHGLPYGAVMATGGAAQLARACAVPGAVRPLLWLAVVEAGWIAGRGVIRHRRELRLALSVWTRIGPPAEHTGVLTVPLGLAVVATGLRAQLGPARALGAALMVLAWLSAVLFVSRFSVSVSHPGRSNTLDGGWFLAPAALLGAGIASGAYATDAAGVLADLLRWGALVAVGVGTTGYWAVVLGSAIAIARRGLGDGPRVLWWIAAGCGGLGAAGLARALSASGGMWPADVVTLVHGAAIVTWSFAALLAVPIVAASVRSLARSRRIEKAAPWPPTFSTAVFALGALGAGKMLGLPAVTDVGKAAACATLALWAVTAALHASRPLPSSGRRPRIPTCERDDPTVPSIPPTATTVPPPR